MAYWQHGEAEIFYEEIGEGTPFLLVHGWAIEHTYLEKALEPIFTSLDKPFRRIYVDLPGMGRSKRGSVRTGEEMMELLYLMMEELTGGKRFFLGGNSFGAGVSRAMAAKHGEKIRGLMLLVPSAGPSAPTAKMGSYSEKDTPFLKGLTIRMRAAFSLMDANLTPEAYERFMEKVYPSMLANAENENLHGIIKGSFSFDIDAAARKNIYAGPVLILTADLDTAVGCVAQKKWLDFYPDAKYVLIEGAGHNVHVDRPEAFFKEVSAWIGNL